LPADAYYSRPRGRGKFGLSSRCRECATADARRHYHEHHAPPPPPSLDPQDDDPSPDEIRAACQQIQATWDTREKLLRRLIGTIEARRRYGYGRIFDDLELETNEAGDVLAPVILQPISRTRKPR
jgi:hypothetical protein